MHLLDSKNVELLDKLISCELELIEKGFMISNLTGKIFFVNTITEFKNTYLKSKYGEILPSMSTEYRYFLIGLLSGVKDEHKEYLISEVFIPTIGKVTTDELIKTLNVKTY